VLALLLPLLLPTACDWSRGSHSYQPYVGLHLDFRAGDFSRDSLTGIAVDAQHGQADVHLGATDWAAGQASTVYGTAPDRSGTLESAPLNATHPFDQAIASWDAQTPTGIWLQVELRTYRPDSSRWTKYYTMAVWASGSDTILRHSVDGQTDGDGNVVTDTLALAGGPVYTRYQYRLTLVTVDPTVSPHVRLVGVMTSNSQRETVGAGTPSNHRAWGTDLSVPPHSQMLYPNGGEGWCSPTSTVMVLGYWGYNVAVPPTPLPHLRRELQGHGQLAVQHRVRGDLRTGDLRHAPRLDDRRRGLLHRRPSSSTLRLRGVPVDSQTLVSQSSCSSNAGIQGGNVRSRRSDKAWT
jgi:hypothetical protein